MSVYEECRILANAMLAKVSPSSTTVLIPLNAAAEKGSQHRIAFYCIHSLSGAAGTDFFPLAQRLPSVRFYGIQAPPKCMFDTNFGSSIRALALCYAESIIAEQAVGPFHLGGWSAGATIALEVAQILRARHFDVGLLIALDGAPANTGGDLPTWNPAYLCDLVLSLARRSLEKGAFDRGKLRTFVGHASRGVGAVAAIIVGKTGGTPRIKRDPFDRFLQAYPHTPEHERFIRRLYHALTVYQPPRSLGGEVIVYASKIGSSVKPAQIGRKWRKIAPQAKVFWVNGSHTSFLVEPHIEGIANDLQRRLEEFGSERV